MRRPGGSFRLTIAAFILALALNAGYTTYAIYSHSRQACSELRILATTRGAVTPYDQAVHRAYGRLYALRCG